MGGKALNKYGVFTERKNTEEFLKIGKEIHEQVAKDLLLHSHVVKCYHTKEDHGDLDLLISTTPFININWRDYIEETFNPQAINSNGGVHSFDYQGFQIDFIPIPELKWECAKIYYSYDPLGNIMGKTFHKFNLSYGWEGLYYKYRNFNGINSNNIFISNDPRKIFWFGGYNYDRYLKGFETLEDIFKFCVDGRFFDAEMFEFENLNCIDKKRNRKRGSYHLFLNYLKNNGIDTKYIFMKIKDSYIYKINDYFPEAKLIEKIAELDEQDKINKEISEKFNGNLVMSWIPELKDKKLGIAMRNFRFVFFSNPELFNQYILSNNEVSIRALFLDFYNREYGL